MHRKKTPIATDRSRRPPSLERVIVIALYLDGPSLRGNIDGIVQLKWAPGDPLLERLPLVVGHHQVQPTIVGLVDLVNGADVGVV